MIQSETRKLPDELKPTCPQCGQRSVLKSDVRLDDCIYECPNCTLQFEATIEISWDSEHYFRKGG